MVPGSASNSRTRMLRSRIAHGLSSSMLNAAPVSLRWQPVEEGALGALVQASVIQRTQDRMGDLDPLGIWIVLVRQDHHAHVLARHIRHIGSKAPG
jgi:hypothetical protein